VRFSPCDGSCLRFPDLEAVPSASPGDLTVFFGNLSVTLSFRLPSQHGPKRKGSSANRAKVSCQTGSIQCSSV
jgi:hypothetical protein